MIEENSERVFKEIDKYWKLVVVLYTSTSKVVGPVCWMFSEHATFLKSS